MRLPWKIVRRSTLERDRARRREQRATDQAIVEEILGRLSLAIEARDVAMKKAIASERRVGEKFTELAQLAHDLKIMQFHINHRTSPDDQRISCVIELRSEMLYHSFRSNFDFHHMLGYMIEDVFRREHPELWRSMLAYPPKR